MWLLLVSLLWGFEFKVSALDPSVCLGSGNDTMTMPFLSLTQPPNPPVARAGGAGLGLLYSFARNFIHTAQPRALPAEIITKAIKNERQDIPQLLQYEAGYFVCLIVTVLYLMMPIIGGILAWQHFRSRKAELNSKPSASTPSYYWNIIVSGCLILIITLLLLGVIFAFLTNNRAHTNLQPSFHHLQKNIKFIEDSLASIPQKTEVVVGQYDIPKTDISKAINGMDDAIGDTLFTLFNGDVQESLSHLSSAVADAVKCNENLLTMESTRASLQTRHRHLQRELQQLQSRLENLQKCSVCDVPDTSHLETDADYSQILSFRDKINSMPPKQDLEGLAEQGGETFRGIHQFCADQLSPTTAALLSELNNTQESLMQRSRNIPSMQPFLLSLTKLREAIAHFERQIVYYDYVRWALALTLCSLMLLIVLLMLAAFSIGLPVLFNPSIYSSYPEARLESRALSLFRASVILSFATSWIFIILVFVTLLLGGNIYTLACEDYSNGKIFTLVDQLDDLSLNVVATQDNQTLERPIRTAAIYEGCMRGRPLSESMEMDEVFDLNDFLNTSKYLNGFSDNTRNMSLNMNELKLLPDKGKKGLLDFRRIGIEYLNYNELLLLLSKPVVKRDLAVLAQELNEKAELPENLVIKEDLQEEARKANHLNTLVEQQTADAVHMSTNVTSLRAISQTYKGNVDNTLTSFNQTEEAMHGRVPFIVANVSRCVTEIGQQRFLHYMDWVRHEFLSEIMGCPWLIRSLNNIHTAVCLNVIDPFNGFWLSFGWCCVFLIPALVLIIYVTRHLKPIPPSPAIIGKDTYILHDIYPKMMNHVEEKHKTEKALKF